MRRVFCLVFWYSVATAFCFVSLHKTRGWANFSDLHFLRISETLICTWFAPCTMYFTLGYDSYPNVVYNKTAPHETRLESLALASTHDCEDWIFLKILPNLDGREEDHPCQNILVWDHSRSGWEVEVESKSKGHDPLPCLVGRFYSRLQEDHQLGQEVM